MLITGVSGLLGSNLAFCLKDAYDIVGVYYEHKVDIGGIRVVNADLTDKNHVHELMKKTNPDIVIHSAAQADVDACEEYPEEARRINVSGTQNLIEQMNGAEPKLIFISTDLVYDGIKGDFTEEDPVNPLNCYGETKREAEKEVIKKKNALILRTNFFGWNVRNRVKYSLGELTIHELTQNKEMCGFTDCHFSSIYTFELAKLLDLAIKKNLSGIYNCASSSSMSKYEFVTGIANRLNFKQDLIKPISIDDFDFKAKRSKNLSLNVSKFENDINSVIPSIEESIDHFVQDFQTNLPDTLKSFGKGKTIYPQLNHISYGRQSIDEEDIQAVTEVLKSDCLTQGAKIKEFEQKLCEFTGAQFGVAVNSGTSALHIACLAAGVQAGDEVITSPNSFVASANCAAYCGAKPVFADIDSKTHNISPKEIENKTTKKTKVIIPVHFAGQSCDMEAIRKIADAKGKIYGHKIMVIEDAAHALGSRYKGKEVGSCQYSDMTVMSFHPVKHITTAEGGGVLTNDADLMKQLKRLRSHGITNDPDELMHDTPGPWYYEQQELGFNYRMTDVQCALGISQLTKLPGFIKRRRKIVNQYNDAFRESSSIEVPYEIVPGDANFHLYVIQVNFSNINLSRSEMIIELKKRGITTQVHYIPIHTQPYYRRYYQTAWGDYPVCEEYYKKCLSIPLYPSLSDSDVQKVIGNIKELVEGDG